MMSNYLKIISESGYNYVVYGSDWDLYRYSYSDIYRIQNVQFIAGIKDYMGWKYPFYVINKKMGSHYPLINNFLEIKPFNDNFSEKRPLCFLYFGTSWGHLSPGNNIVEKNKRLYPNCRSILFMQDLVEKFIPQNSLNAVINQFDLVLSFDPGDCDKYHLLYHPLVFSKYVPRGRIIDSDVYMLAKAKDRVDQFYAMYDKLIGAGLNVRFILKDVPQTKKQNLKGVRYIDGRENVSYLKNLEYIERSKCILEIMQGGGTGYTQRGCEAVGLNRLLLTNNIYMKETSFYKKNNISIINSNGSIDYDFIDRIKNSLIYDYGEEEREKMSPIELLSFITQKIELC